jgi:hypothetical protein
MNGTNRILALTTPLDERLALFLWLEISGGKPSQTTRTMAKSSCIGGVISLLQ